MKPKYITIIHRSTDDQFYATVVSKYRPKKPVWTSETYPTKQVLKKILKTMPSNEVRDESDKKRGPKPAVKAAFKKMPVRRIVAMKKKV